MKISEQKDKARKYVGEGKCYVTAEGNNGKTKLIMSGDIVSIIHSIVAIANRVSEITGVSFEDVITAVMDMRYNGYASFCKNLGKREFKEIQEEDLFKTELNEVKEQMKQIADQRVAVVTQQNTVLRRELETLNNSISQTKKGYEGRINVLQGQVKELTKDIVRLEHEKLMIQKLVKGE